MENDDSIIRNQVLRWLLAREERLMQSLHENDVALLAAGGDDRLMMRASIRGKGAEGQGLREVSFRTKKGLEYALRGAIKKYRKTFSSPGPIDGVVAVDVLFGKVTVPLGNKRRYKRLYDRLNTEAS